MSTCRHVLSTLGVVTTGSTVTTEATKKDVVSNTVFVGIF